MLSTAHISGAPSKVRLHFARRPWKISHIYIYNININLQWTITVPMNGSGAWEVLCQRGTFLFVVPHHPDVCGHNTYIVQTASPLWHEGRSLLLFAFLKQKKESKNRNKCINVTVRCQLLVSAQLEQRRCVASRWPDNMQEALSDS